MIYIKEDIINGIVQQAKEGTPLEICGYLAGKNNLISNCYKLTNKDRSSEHYSFIPKEQFDTLRDVRDKGLELMVVYHSHPASPARMSDEDIKLAYDKDILYAIISLQQDSPVVKFFDMSGGMPNEIEFKIIDK